MTINLQANRGRTLEELFGLLVAGKEYCYFQKQHNLWIPWKGSAFPAGGAPIDFIGVIKGIPVAVECKEVTGKSFPFCRLPQKEFEALRAFEGAGGKAFLLVMQNPDQQLWLAPFPLVRGKYSPYLENRGRKGFGSVPLTWFIRVPDPVRLIDMLWDFAALPQEK